MFTFKNKKGALGLDTAKDVMLWFLVLAVLGIAIMLALTSLMPSVEDIDKSTTRYDNETFTGLTAVVQNLSGSVGRINAVCTIHAIQNVTLVDAGNFTLSGSNCLIRNTTLVTDYSGAGAEFNITYSVTYANPETRGIVQNVSGALTNNFFDQTGTIFAILIVVVIMFAIGLIIYVVTRFSTGSGVGASVGGSKGEYGSDTVMGI
jgi:hypothetical protein